MQPLRPPAAVLVPLFVVLYAAAGSLSAVRDRVAPRDVLREGVLYVPSPAVMDRMVLSYDALAADFYWMRAIQHFGDTRLATQGARRYELLYPLLNITTALDPKFNIAYRFGAIFLSEAPPGGPGRPDLAIELLKRGLEARPDRWQYMQDIGMVEYMNRQDYPAAAEWFERAADVPGAPWWLRSLAANTRAVGGDRAGSRALWTALRDSATDNEWLRNDATRRLQQLDALDAVDTLQRAVDAWVAQGATRPYDWYAMVKAGRLPGVPADPSGTVFYLGPYTGTVDVADESPLRPLPADATPRRPR
jgi:tetratricopeptide (TPR) repeat protein